MLRHKRHEEHIIAKTQAKCIVLSYNNDGFMSKTHIEAVMKRYGKEGTYLCRKISYMRRVPIITAYRKKSAMPDFYIR